MTSGVTIRRTRKKKKEEIKKSGTQQIERNFREVWRKVFQISEEEEELFDDQHDTNIKKE